MPWFDPQPSQAELDYWLLPNGAVHKVSLWPHPNSNRVDCRFRQNWNPSFHPTASKWFLHFHGEPRPIPDPAPPIDLYGWFDLEAGSIVFDMEGFIPVDGQALEVEIGVHAPTLGFVSGVPSTEWVITLTDPVEQYTSTDVLEWTRDGPRPWRVQIDSDTYPPDFVEHNFSAFWPWDNEIRIVSISDCYTFPPPEPVGPGFATFNGVDAYIALAASTTQINSRWQVSAEMYLRDHATNWVLCRSNNTTSICGFAGDRAWWRSNNGLLTPNLPLNQWFNMRFERNWSVPTGNRFRVFVDDVQAANFGGSNFGLTFNRVGGDRGTTPRQYGNFDMRNLLVLEGTPAAPLVRLDMPLVENACDLSPFLLHGTTFNMDLPSCP